MSRLQSQMPKSKADHRLLGHRQDPLRVEEKELPKEPHSEANEEGRAVKSCLHACLGCVGGVFFQVKVLKVKGV